jgi:hypothetical protein
VLAFAEGMPLQINDCSRDLLQKRWELLMHLAPHHPDQCDAHVQDQPAGSGHDNQVRALFEDVSDVAAHTEMIGCMVSSHTVSWTEVVLVPAFVLFSAIGLVAGNQSKQSHHANSCYLQCC